MLILGIDTSTDILGLALLKENKLLGEYNLNLKRQHSEKLLPLLKEIFNHLDLTLRDLDGVAVAVGPGSFTGLRIGITTAKMLGRIFSIPVKGISTLEIMAAGVENNYLLPLLDARRKRVYYSFYKKSNSEPENIFLEQIKEAASTNISELPQILAAYRQEKIVLVGEKTAEVKEIMTKNGFIVKKASDEKNTPRAAVLAELGLAYIKAGDQDDIYKLKPAYLKKPQAEINWQQKYGSK